jgi:hypothetical protein
MFLVPTMIKRMSSSREVLASMGRVHLLEVDGYARPPRTVVLSPYTPFSQPKLLPVMVVDIRGLQYLPLLIPVGGE